MRRLRIALVILPVIVGATFFSARSVVAQHGQAKLAEVGLRPEHVDAMIADMELVERTGVVSACPLTHDAGELLNPLLGMDDGTHPAPAPAWWAEGSVMSALKAGGSKWEDHVVDAPTGDLSITRSLLAYDGWEPYASGPGAATLADLVQTDAFRVGLPHMVPLQVLAKLRMLEGLRTRDVLPALQEVRHLAGLVGCQESLIGAMIGVAILGVEARGYEAAVAAGSLGAEAWTPVPEATREAMKRLAMALPLAYVDMAPEGTLARIEERPGLVYGRCAAIGEAVMWGSVQKALLGRRLPLELNHDERLAAIDAAFRGSGCRLLVMRTFWEHPEWNAAMLATPDLNLGLPWGLLPYVRDVKFYELGAQMFGTHNKYADPAVSRLQR